MIRELREIHNWLAMIDASQKPTAPAAVVLCGSSVIDTLRIAAGAAAASSFVVVTGGVGHSTPDLFETVRRSPELNDADISGCIAEADVFGRLLTAKFEVPHDKIILERLSTNCGANAQETVPILVDLLGKQEEKSEDAPIEIVLVQDPTMMRRSMASFQKHLEGLGARWRLIPSSIEFDNFVDASDEGTITPKAYSRERYLDLISGELPRLRDDANGYGPNGKGFISHVEIPDRITECYEVVLRHIGSKARALL